MAKNKIDNYLHGDSSIVYTDTNIPGPGMEIEAWNEALIVQCTCRIHCGEECLCVYHSGGKRNYVNCLLTEEKLVANTYVLECNDFCSCPATCGNRLVQLGPREYLTVFQTGERGYGLKTERNIERGSFICEYAGEVISREEGKRRARQDSINYIFVLKEHFSNSITETIVDPTCIGNIGRYINHSCQPNAVVIPVRIDSPIPRLAIFAKSNIEEGEEITYDYANGGVGIGTTLCLCGTESCRKFLPFDKNLFN